MLPHRSPSSCRHNLYNVTSVGKSTRRYLVTTVAKRSFSANWQSKQKRNQLGKMFISAMVKLVAFFMCYSNIIKLYLFNTNFEGFHCTQLLKVSFNGCTLFFILRYFSSFEEAIPSSLHFPQNVQKTSQIQCSINNATDVSDNQHNS